MPRTYVLEEQPRYTANDFESVSTLIRDKKIAVAVTSIQHKIRHQTLYARLNSWVVMVINQVE